MSRPGICCAGSAAILRKAISSASPCRRAGRHALHSRGESAAAGFRLDAAADARARAALRHLPRMTLEFGAPWSRSLKRASTVSTCLLALIAVVGTFGLPARLWPTRALLIALPVLVLAIALVNMVSGYALSSTELEVRRPLWSNSFPLAELQAVNADPLAFKGALRLFGNGGLFAFTGYFWITPARLVSRVRNRSGARGGSAVCQAHHPHHAR